METVTIATSRGLTVADMEMLVGSAVIVVALAWMIFSKMRHLRGRHQEEPRV
jgi:ABC-type nickel/cobalt efflux system permease component RcnA